MQSKAVAFLDVLFLIFHIFSIASITLAGRRLEFLFIFGVSRLDVDGLLVLSRVRFAFQFIYRLFSFDAP